MTSAIIQLAAKVADLQRKLAASHRPGIVSEVDPGQGLVRLDLGDGMLSPWIPYVQTAGALRVHSPPSPGQMMAMIAPSGETSQGFATSLAFGGGIASPSSAPDQHVIAFGDVSLTLTEGGIVVSAGGVSFRVSQSGVEITGGSVTHNGINIGSTHRHGGVDRGGSSTNGPE